MKLLFSIMVWLNYWCWILNRKSVLFWATVRPFLKVIVKQSYSLLKILEVLSWSNVVMMCYTLCYFMVLLYAITQNS